MLARLFVAAIRSKPSVGDLLDAVEHLPPTIDEQYDRTWNRILELNLDNQHLARRVLSFLTYARRPLTVLELRHAFAVKAGEYDINQRYLVAEDVLEPCCLGLVAIEAASRTIRFTHGTTQQYFTDSRSLLFPDAQTEILRICLGYLSFKEFETGPCEFRFSDGPCDFRVQGSPSNSRLKGKRIASRRFLAKRLTRFPFLQYAATRWGEHAMGDLEILCKDDIVAFLRKSKTLKSAVQVLDPDMICCRPDLGEDRARVTINLPLWVVSSLGLTHIIVALLSLEGKIDVNSSYGFYRTALHAAVESENLAVTRALLAVGADPFRLGDSTLCSAIRLGND